MPVYQHLLNLDEVFICLKEKPTIINYLSTDSEEDKHKVNTSLMSCYTSDMLSILPGCSCRMTKGESMVGQICPHCNTPVRTVIGEDVEPLNWIEAPEGPEGRLAFINPIVFTILKNRFKKSGFCVISWLCDRRYDPQVKTPPVIAKLVEDKIPRGYGNFIKEFFRIIHYLTELKDFRVKKGQKDGVLKLLNAFPDRIFSRYIPIPNRSLMIVEKTNVGTYVDPSLIKAKDAINMMIGVDAPDSLFTPKDKERRAFRCLDGLCQFYAKYTDDSIRGKPGIIRKHLFGSRTHFSFRAVMTSITGKHWYDEIWAPWIVGLTTFRPHVINKLINEHHYRLNDAIDLITRSVYKYHPLLDQILQQLINESPEKGIVVLMGRNPSLHAGSLQRLRITRFKSDPLDLSASASILIVKAFNLDFDGDAANFAVAIDNFMAKLWEALSPHNNVVVLGKPREISQNLSLPAPVVSTINNFITSKERYHFTEQQISNFQQLLE